MIDLKPAILKYLSSDTELTSKISVFNGVPAIFTIRPVPEQAKYPMVVISSIITDSENDFISCNGRRTLTHDISVYDNNSETAKFRNVEKVAFRIAKLMHRMEPFSLDLPAGSSLIQTTATGPLAGATDDLVKVARVVVVNFEILLEN